MHNLNSLGVVVKIEGNEAVVMTDDAVFKRVKLKQSMFPGQKILIKNEDLSREGRKSLKQYYTIAVSVAAALILIFAYAFLMKTGTKPTYAYISVDINPSIELEVNEKEVATDIRALNPDAEKLTDGMKVNGLYITDALKYIIDKSIEKDYIKKGKENNYILIAAALVKEHINDEQTVLEEGKKLDGLLDGLKADLEKAYGNTISPKVMRVPAEYREKANENNISMGKYLIYSETRKMGKEMSMEKLKKDNLYDLLHDIDIDSINENELNTDTQLSEKATPVPSRTVAPIPVITAVSPAKASASTLPVVNTGAAAPVNTPATASVNTATLPPKYQQGETARCKGLIGEYYDNKDFTCLKLTRIDPEVNFRWADGSPDSSIDSDTFSVRWTGKIVPEFSEKYTFSTYADDGARLWINNVLIIDDWKSHSPGVKKGSLELRAGTEYDIRLEYFEDVKACQVKLSWESSSRKSEIIPANRLFHYAKVYQAEKAGYSRSVTETTNTGYTGTGYVNFLNEAGSYIKWTVNVAKSGIYTLNFGYANGTSVNRPMEITVNNTIISNGMNFNSTNTWTNWKNACIKASLKSGINIIRATSVTATGGPNIDYLEIQ